MTRMLASVVLGISVLVLSCFIMPSIVAPAQAQPLYEVAMLNQAGERITSLTDGALVRFEITLAQITVEPATFSLHLDQRANQVATCTIRSGAASCITAPVGTLGWYWQDGTVAPARRVHFANTALARWLPLGSLEIAVKPRPVVMVHGFGANYTTWLTYLGPSG